MFGFISTYILTNIWQGIPLLQHWLEYRKWCQLNRLNGSGDLMRVHLEKF